jgi:tripartite motif-containing protein 71
MLRGTALALLFGALTITPATAAADLTPLDSFGSLGAGAGQLDQPTDVEVNPFSGLIYVADKYNDRISEFDPHGSFLRAFGWGVLDGSPTLQVCTSTCQGGIAGSGAGQLDKPTGIAVDYAGMLYVGDKYNNRVSEFTSEGDFVRAFGWGVATGAPTLEVCTTATGCQAGLAGGGAGQINQARGVAVDRNDNTVYVAEEQNHRISEFTTTGEFIRAFGWNVGNGSSAEVCTISCQAGSANPNAGGMAFPRAVDVDGLTVYVGNSGDNRIDEFTHAGTFIRGFGEDVVNGASPGTGPQVCTTDTGCQAGTPTGNTGTFTGALNGTYGVIAAGGAVYASDTFGERVNQYTPSGSFIQSLGWGVSDGSAAFQICTSACQKGSTGSGSGQFNAVDGLAFDGCRGLYVADRFNDRIQRFTQPWVTVSDCDPILPCSAGGASARVPCPGDFPPTGPPSSTQPKKKCKKHKHRSAKAAKKCKKRKK